MNEKSYLEILNAFYTMIEADPIPKKDKEKIIKTMQELHEMLWQYSA